MDDSADRLRKIIHIDMDAFFASVEQRDDPALRGKPVAVGYASARGVVAAASYEARSFGVRSAMPSITAQRKCPDLIFMPPRFDVYREVSRQVRAIFADYTPHIEPLSLDEAYLDVTENLQKITSATAIAEHIRARIKAETGLTASAGVSSNKFLAKLASDQNKPDGLCVVRPEQGEAFVATLPVSRFHGVGPVTARKMHALGIHTGADLRMQELPFLERQFGNSARYYYWASRGRDDRPVRANAIRKSIGAERTFSADLSSESDLIEALEPIIEDVWHRIERAVATGRTITLKVKFTDFQQMTRAHSLPLPIASKPEFAQIGRELLHAQLPFGKGVRLLGLTISNLDHDLTPETPRQLALSI
ncbi:DNA polymerase IV [Rhizorhapis sp. SPR117]|uniref:DNA polymerase IV n=1 Tax=Rhizorhapis sp. SPR117 TaxID=2912611 RepID=UPI001F00815F|nr:DNA polymerase IV [Rhizorhapis sp. SPR117]